MRNGLYVHIRPGDRERIFDWAREGATSADIVGWLTDEGYEDLERADVLNAVAGWEAYNQVSAADEVAS